MNFKKKFIKDLSVLIVSIMIINFISCNIFQSFAEEIGIETDLKIKVEYSDGYTNICNYDDLIDNKLYISNPNCNITFSNGLNTEDISDDIIICTINDLNKYNNLKSRYKIKWIYYPFDLTVEPATASTNTTIRLVTYINGDMSVDGYLKSNDLLILKQQLLFDYNIVQTGTYNNNSEVGGNFSIVGYDSDKCNSISLNGDLYADNSMTIHSNNGNLNGTLMCKGTVDISLKNKRTSYRYFNKELLLNEDDINQLYFTNIESQGNINYPENTSNININEDIVSNGTIDLIATNSINLNASIKAENNIHINGEVHNTNNAIIYSKKDIIIQNDSTFSFTGMIYAPNGKVIIKAKNVNITGTIIAKDINIQAEVVNFNINDYIINNNTSKILSALQLFLGDMNNSGILDEEDFKIIQCILLGEEYINWEDKDNNNIPDILENEEEWKNYIYSDNDGLPDFLEIYLGTDKMLSDTDNDGLNDYIEVMILNTNPCLKDTDNNGILDGDEDYDGDGLTNLEELEIGTDMTNIDTDEDGLDDYYEIKISNTNPLSKDTDGNRINDGDELFNQEVEIEVNNEESAISGVKVELPTQRKNYNVTSIESVMGIDIMSSNVVGLVGEPYNFTTEGDFSEAIVTFKINPENLGNTNFENLAVLWYDEEIQCYELLDTQLNVDTYEISAVTPHFSTGLVVDKSLWYNVTLNDLYDDKISYQSCDTAMILDCSGSIDTETREKEILSAIEFINTKENNEKVSIIAEDSTAIDMTRKYINSSLSSSQLFLTYTLNNMINYDYAGGNNFYSSLSMALNNLKDSSSDSKSIIFLSDGYYDLDEINRTTHETTRDLITKIQKDGIKIYTIGFNAPYEGKNNLKYMAEETNGKFFEINSLEDAKMIFNTINVYKNLIFTNPEDGILDSDNDGLLDFFETQEFKLANGKTINLKDYCNNPETNPDCDNDGILDGEEITLQLGLFRQNNNINSQRDFYLVINSYPDNPDSDNDYYMDNVDTQKLHFDAMQIIDEKLNDDNSIDGTNPSADNNDYTDGILNSVPIGEGECSKNEYTFTRNTDKKCEFTITPKKNSDYTISISNPNCLLNISNKEKFSFIDISNNSISGINKTDNSITYNLVLKKDVTYNIYIEDNSSTNSQYTVSVSQDNWVYAPKGAAVKETPLSKSIDFYITDEIIFEIIQYQLKNHNNGVGYNSPNIESYLSSKDTLEKWEKSTAADSILIIDNLNEGYTEWNNLMNEIGTTASLMGLVTLVDKTGISGTIVTLLGAGSALLLQNDEEELAKALQDGKYNIRLVVGNDNIFNPIGDNFNFKFHAYQGWNDKYYINKYLSNDIYRNYIIQNIDIKEIKFDSSNNKWYYLDENGDKICIG